MTARNRRRPPALHRRHSALEVRARSAHAPERLEARLAMATLPTAQVAWSSYTGSTTGGSDDAVTSAWVVRATDANQYGDKGDMALIQVNGELKGVFSSTLENSGFVDGLIKTSNATTLPNTLPNEYRGDYRTYGVEGGISQVMVSADGKRLYVGGTTVKPGWAVKGFDQSLSTGIIQNERNYLYPQLTTEDDRYFSPSSSSYFVNTQDGFLARYDVTASEAGAQKEVKGAADYVTFLGGDGESIARPYADQRSSWIQNGRDYVNSFYVDVNGTGQDVFAAGRTQARKGFVDKLAQPESTFIDENRAFGEFGSNAGSSQADIVDGMLFSLRDPALRDASVTKNYATYLSPQSLAGQTDDGENIYKDIWTGRINEVDFIWSATSAGTGDRLIFMLATVRKENTPTAELKTCLVTINETELKNITPEGDADDPKRWAFREKQLRDWVHFQDFTYDRKFREKQISNTAMRTDETGTGPALLLRYEDQIRKIDLPRNSDVKFDAGQKTPQLVKKGTWGGWFKPFDGEISPAAMSVSPNGKKLYVVSTVQGYQWEGYPVPVVGERTVGGTFSGGKGRSGPSDAVIMELDVASPIVNWMMLQGGDGVDKGTGVTAFSDGTVWLMGTTNSSPTSSNPDGWIPTSKEKLLGNLGMPKDVALTRNNLGIRQTYSGDGGADGFIVAIRTGNAAAGEIDVAGSVNGAYQAIVDGSQTPAAANGTVLPKSFVGGVAAERTFRIANQSGSEPLKLTATNLPTWLKLKAGSSLPAAVQAGSAVEFTVVVDNRVAGAYVGEISIDSSDEDELRYNFRVSAEVAAPPPSTFSVAAAAAASVLEGNSGTKAVSFTVTLTPGAPAPVYPLTVAYSLVGVTATAGTDFTGGSGTLTFASASDLVKTVAATVRGDAQAEQNETFKLVLSSPSSGVVSAEAGEAVVTITNDDGTPKPLSVGFAPATYRVPEGAAGTTTLVPLTIQLTESQATDVVVSYATSNGTASAGSDYTATSGTVKILAGQTQGTLNVVVKGDATGESDETFTVRLTSSTGGVLLNPAAATVTIVNDDGAAPLPAVRVSTASVTEGNTGTPKMTFTITLAKALTTATVLTYATLDGTAKAGSHYVAATGTVTIPAGRTSATVTVTVKPNRIVDGNRTLSLQVRSGSTLVATGVGTIIDDDKAAVRAAFAAFAAEPVSPGVTKKK